MSDVDTMFNSIITEIARLKADVSFLKGLPVPALATAATANTVVLRDGSGNATVTALTGNVTGNLTGNVTGNSSGTHTGAVVGTTVSASGAMTASAGLLAPRSSGTQLFGLDFSGTGSSLTINNNTTATPFGNANNFSGKLLVHDTTVDGALGEFLCGGGNVEKIAETVAVYAVPAKPGPGTAGKVSVYYNASNVLIIDNKSGNNRVLNIVGMRSRNSA